MGGPGEGTTFPALPLTWPGTSLPSSCSGILSFYNKLKSESHSVMSDSLRPHGLSMEFSGICQNTGVGSLSFF